MTIGELLAWARHELGEGSDAAIDARVLMGHVSGLSHAQLLIREDSRLQPEQSLRFQELVCRRAQGEPVAYLIGQREFWRLNLTVSSDTLIPRPDTEILVEAALEKAPADHPCRVLDLGTGTGAIALSLALERPAWEVIATDLQPDALKLARQNALAHGLNQLRFIEGRWFDPIEPLNLEPFDLIVSNPPYIAENDPHLTQGDLRYEPTVALVSGPDGLAAIREIIAQAPAYLVEGGWLILEHGYDQGEAVRALLCAAGLRDIETRRDLGGQERISLGRRPTG